MTSDHPSSISVQLDYSQAPSPRRKWIRRGAWLAIIVTAACAGWRWGPYVWRQTQVLYWQRLCMRHTLPVSQVVYDEEPTAVALLRRNSDYQPIAADVPAAGYMPACARQYFDRLFGLPFGQDWALLFMHEMRQPDGQVRLVAVFYSQVTVQQRWQGVVTSAIVVQPGTLIGRPSLVGHEHVNYGTHQPGYPEKPWNAQFYAGQLDPQNPSHFTVGYQLWGKSDVLDGRLDNAGRVTVTERNPPKAD